MRAALRSTLIILLAVPASLRGQAPPPPANTPLLVEIRDLTPREHRVQGFELTAPQDLQITAVGAEPREDGEGDGDGGQGSEDERTTWPAAAWILNARTREVVWDLRDAETQRARNGVRRFAGTVRLPAGTYEAHYGSYPAAWASFNGEFSLRSLTRMGRRARYGGPYVEDGSYKEFALTIAGTGRRVDQTAAAFSASAIVSLHPAPASVARYGFELTRPTDVEVYAIGEVRRDGAFDYGWIINADTRARVWRLDYEHSDPAGGAHKNRMARETLHLPAGRYAAYFVCDDTHDADEWNAVPAVDPAFWGLTLRVADPAARAAVRPFEYSPVPPADQTLASLTAVGDRASRSSGFTLRRPMDVRVYALGEGANDEMVDYAWIVDASTHRRVWTMRYADTEGAGGAGKNRLFDGTLQLAAGSYLVYYTSDGSHAFGSWNAAPPAEPRYWGVTIFPAKGRLDPADVAPFVRRPGGDVLAELVRMGNDEQARDTFRLDRDANVRVYALGEGDDDMVDYGWIEEAGTGHVVWEMTYRTTQPAGGARKNRVFDGVIHLKAGAYVLRFESDGSHAYAEWNANPPDDADSWGITVYRVPPTKP